MPKLLHGFTEARRDRAQVFADNQEAAPRALQRQDPQQILPALVDVGSVGGGAAVGNPEEAEEAHHVIDAQRAAVPRIPADGLDEEAVAVFPVGGASWAAERPSPALPARNRRAASRRGSRAMKCAG